MANVKGEKKSIKQSKSQTADDDVDTASVREREREVVRGRENIR